MDTANTELIRSHVDTIILNVLLERDRYGYEILELIDSKSDGRYAIKQPTLYSCLKRLEKQGFISSYFGDESNGGRRRYYKLTEKGINTLTQDQREWEFSRSILDRLLSDRQIDLKTVDAPFDPNELRPLTKRVKAYEPEEKPEKVEKSSIVIPITVEARVNPAALTIEKPAEKPEPQKKPEKDMEKEEKLTEPQKVSLEEEYRLREKRLAAERLLQLGDFSAPPPILSKETEEPKEKPYPFVNLDEVFRPKEDNSARPNANYRETLGAIFSVPKKEAPAAALVPDEEADNTAEKARHFNDLKQTLLEEGYKLRSYSKSNSANYYYMNYIYGNRIMRDTFLITYLMVLIELLCLYLGKDFFMYSLGTLSVIGGAALIVPAVPLVVWALNPTKRIKAKFNFLSSLINALILFILIAAISTIICLVSPSIEYGFDSGKMYVPYILALNIPLSVIIYNVLYKSKNYHLKN